MSVLIKGMKMPKGCGLCRFDDYGYCTMAKQYSGGSATHGRASFCPLVEVPEKHGRLVDGDVLWDAMSKYNDNEGAKMPFGYDDPLIHIDSACFVIENAPTVIDAEDL